jgi:hypothetical protein
VNELGESHFAFLKHSSTAQIHDHLQRNLTILMAKMSKLSVFFLWNSLGNAAVQSVESALMNRLPQWLALEEAVRASPEFDDRLLTS